MIHVMTCDIRVVRILTLAFSLTGFVSKAIQPAIQYEINSDPVDGRATVLNIRVYSFPGLSPWLLRSAETEATRLLHDVGIHFDWIDCTSREVPQSCRSSEPSSDLIVRFLVGALPKADLRALGAIGVSDGSRVAFLFYERIAFISRTGAMRNHMQLLPLMMGRVLAHEITHLLLPERGHTDFGLMKAFWPGDDLQILRSESLGLSLESVRLMKREALRRALERGRQPWCITN